MRRLSLSFLIILHLFTWANSSSDNSKKNSNERLSRVKISRPDSVEGRPLGERRFNSSVAASRLDSSIPKSKVSNRTRTSATKNDVSTPINLDKLNHSREKVLIAKEVSFSGALAKSAEPRSHEFGDATAIASAAAGLQCPHDSAEI